MHQTTKNDLLTLMAAYPNPVPYKRLKHHGRLANTEPPLVHLAVPVVEEEIDIPKRAGYALTPSGLVAAVAATIEHVALNMPTKDRPPVSGLIELISHTQQTALPRLERTLAQGLLAVDTDRCRPPASATPAEPIPLLPAPPAPAGLLPAPVIAGLLPETAQRLQPPPDTDDQPYLPHSQPRHKQSSYPSPLPLLDFVP